MKGQQEKHPYGSHAMPHTPIPAKRPQQHLPWSALEQQVVRMQKQITQACQHGNRQTVHTLQQRLMESEAARLLAVRRVTEENQGKHTAGVDGVKSLTADERLAMAATIHPKNWKQQHPEPLRRVWIAKPGTTERRPLAILPMIDRCKQALMKLALEPEWEVQFEPHSYGFRPGRGVHDAIAALVVAIEQRPAFVFAADIEGAFEHVNQTVVLDKLHTTPALRETIAGWLKAGVVDAGQYMPTEMGIPQGGILSPLLLNVALHGMEGVATACAAWEQPLLVRYADDLVMVHADLHALQQAISRVKQWLAAMGLHFNTQKTQIAHTLTAYQGQQAGFDFLGFHMQQERREPGGKQRQQDAHKGTAMRSPSPQWLIPQANPPRVKTSITPAQEAEQRHFAAIEQRLQQLRAAPQAQVIAELNPLITGWVAYYNGIVPATTMSHYDTLIEQRLLRWAAHRHPDKAREWLLARYWHPSGTQQHVFATHDGGQLRAYRPASILQGERERT